jgi:hypothetical protein
MDYPENELDYLRAVEDQLLGERPTPPVLVNPQQRDGLIFLWRLCWLFGAVLLLLIILTAIGHGHAPPDIRNVRVPVVRSVHSHLCHPVKLGLSCAG